MIKLLPLKLTLQKIFCLFMLTSLSNLLLGQAPVITSFTPFGGTVGSLVTINGTNLSPATAITVGGVVAIPVSVTSTQLVAMVMPGSASGRVRVTTAGGTGVSPLNFIVIINSPPSIQQGAKLVGTGSIATSLQGTGVALSADGNTAAMGAPGDNNFTGAIWIFTRSGGIWTQQTKITSPGAVINSRLGQSVSLSADGNTLVAGASGVAEPAGAVWVFTRSGTVWTQQGGKLTGTGGLGNSLLGVSIALSADGNTFVAGGQGDNSGIGAAWIFTRSAGVWSQQGGKLIGTGSVGSVVMQGAATSISSDGNTVAVGGSNDNIGAGAAWVFTRSGGAWTQQGAKLTCPEANASFGSGVALSADGNTLAAGAKGIYVFTRTGVVWSQQGSKLVGTGAVGGDVFQGGACGISADGNTIVETGFLDNGDIGACWVFSRSEITWSQAGVKLVGTGYVDKPHVNACGISADGNTAITGGPTDGGAAAGVGASWIFVSPSIAEGALPVNLMAFSGNNNGSVNQLEWTTAVEENSASIEVQRSIDGSSFVSIGTLPAAGNSAVSRVYNYNDNVAGTGLKAYYYRLKMIDKDGHYKYSAILKINADINGTIMTVSPNPFIGQLRIGVVTGVRENGFANLRDLNGKIVLRQAITLKMGSNIISVSDLDKIPFGVYMLTIQTNTKRQTFKVVK